jgi:hypothetical protein
MKLVAAAGDPLLMPTLIMFTPETGGPVVGTVDEINAILAATGYAAVAIRRNVIGGFQGNDQLYLEAKDTPIYCSPASETYWSM